MGKSIRRKILTSEINILPNILYIVLVIIIAMIITLAIGVWRMERRLDKKIDKIENVYVGMVQYIDYTKQSMPGGIL